MYICCIFVFIFFKLFFIFFFNIFYSLKYLFFRIFSSFIFIHQIYFCIHYTVVLRCAIIVDIFLQGENHHPRFLNLVSWTFSYSPHKSVQLALNCPSVVVPESLLIFVHPWLHLLIRAWIISIAGTMSIEMIKRIKTPIYYVW